MTELEKKTEQAKVERARRYPLLVITESVNEIREVAMSTQEYLQELYPDLVRIKIWEAIPRIVIEFLLASFTKLDKKEAMKNGTSTFIIGNIMEIGIEGMKTTDGDKDGNLTPFIVCRSEFKFENASLPYNDEISIDEMNIMVDEKCEHLPIQFFENREEIKEITKIAMLSLRNKYGIMFGDDSHWDIIPRIVMAFFRKTKDYLISHKDDGEAGIEINFADVIKMGIAKEGGIEEGDPVEYFLFIKPKRIFKKDYAKDDAITEE